VSSSAVPNIWGVGNSNDEALANETNRGFRNSRSLICSGPRDPLADEKPRNTQVLVFEAALLLPNYAVKISDRLNACMS
jgi:hypothetical protein